MPTVAELLTDDTFAERVENARKYMHGGLVGMTKADALLGVKLVDCPAVGCDNQHTVNVPLLRKVVDQITNHPESWEQGSWASYALPEDAAALFDALPSDSELFFESDDDYSQAYLLDESVLSCGSSFCVAGWAVQLTGHTMVTDEDELAYAIEESRTHRVYAHWVNSTGKNGQPVSIASQAQHELGLTDYVRSTLFAGSNSLPSVIGFCQALAESVGESLF